MTVSSSLSDSSAGTLAVEQWKHTKCSGEPMFSPGQGMNQWNVVLVKCEWEQKTSRVESHVTKDTGKYYALIGSQTIRRLAHMPRGLRIITTLQWILTNTVFLRWRRTLTRATELSSPLFANKHLPRLQKRRLTTGNALFGSKRTLLNFNLPVFFSRRWCE